jgi:hypothetical protein
VQMEKTYAEEVESGLRVSQIDSVLVSALADQQNHGASTSCRVPLGDDFLCHEHSFPNQSPYQQSGLNQVWHAE